MVRNSAGPYFTYALILTLLGSALSTVAIVPPAYADHDNIIIDIDDEYDPGQSIEISGVISDLDEDVTEVTIFVTEPDGTDDDFDVDLDDEEFSLDYDVGNDDGIYTVEVQYDTDSAFNYFLVDDDDDDVEVETDASAYEQGDTIQITGTVTDPELGEEDVEIILMDPHGDSVIDEETAEIDGDGDFDYEYDLDDEAETGRYALKIVYNGEEGGWLTLEVEEGSGSSSGGDITASITDATVAPGDEVEITGQIDEGDIEGGAEVILVVEDPDGDEIAAFEDSVEPDSDTGDFDFTFELDDDADTGTYTVILSYEQLDDRELTFTVSTSSGGGSSGGSGGSGSGSDSGLTAKLSKTSLLAGETLTVSGVVPRIVTDEDGVSITITTPAGNFVAAKFPEPASDESYTASFVLPSTLAEDEDYRVVVYYDDKEVELEFDVTGKATGSVGALTVKTDKTSYSVGSTVTISGQISDEIFVEGQQIALQVFNPDDAPYRFDPIVPEDDGSYSYPMPVGGPLGVTGEWQVKVTYGTQTSETTFDLTGGVPSTPKYDLRVDDDTFTIEYESDGPVNSMYVRPAEKKLVVSIDGEDDGQLTITLPREVIDAVQSGSDVQYVVSTLDTQTGEQRMIDITEGVSNAAERTITIDYEAGTDLIEIQGTSIVPEFGPLSAIVLAVAVFSIIAITARFSNRLSAFKQW
jgi:predicted secreted protein with PEFG-CTERM motif